MKLQNDSKVQVATAIWHAPSKTIVTGLRAAGIAVEAVDEDADRSLYQAVGFADPGTFRVSTASGPQLLAPRTLDKLNLECTHVQDAPLSPSAIGASAVLNDDVAGVLRVWPQLSAPERTAMLCVAATVGADGAAVVCAAKLRNCLDQQDESGNTAMHYAALTGRSDIANMMLDLGAKPDVLNGVETQPMHDAARGGSYHVLRSLRDHGADLSVPNIYGDTLVHRVAIFAEHARERDYLHAYLVCMAAFKKTQSPQAVSEYINSTGVRGYTALDWAVSKKHTKLAAALILDGAQHGEAWAKMSDDQRQNLDQITAWDAHRESSAA